MITKQSFSSSLLTSTAVAFVLLLLVPTCTLAFAPTTTTTTTTTSTFSIRLYNKDNIHRAPPTKLSSPPSFLSSQLFLSQDNSNNDSSNNNNNNNKSKTSKRSSIDTNTRSRLLSESIAPWRTLRLFLYFALGSGAGLGGLITLAGVAASLSGARSDLDLNTEYINLAIDFGAVAVFALLAKWDLDKAGELDARVKERLEKKKQNEGMKRAMKEREKTLSKLNLEIRVSEDGMSSQVAPVEAVQRGGKQHLIIVAGPKKAIRDSLLGANLLKMEFAMRDVLIVPYETTSMSGSTTSSGKNVLKKQDEAKVRPDGSGFGGVDNRPTWETQPYVAQATGEGWEEYIEAEMRDAIKQNGESVKQDGIAIVVANTGEIIRRGVGKVPWRSMVEELEKTVKDEPLVDLGFLQG